MRRPAQALRTNGFTIDDKMRSSVLERRLDDPRISLSPIVTVAIDQTDALALTLNAQAVAVVLLVQPDRRMRDSGALVGMQKSNALIMQPTS
jgi:hypothetical protein